MKKLIAALLVLFGISGGAFASQELKTVLAFNTTPFLCTAGPATAVYWNNSGAPMYIRRTEVWMGMDQLSKGDFAAKVKVNSNQTILAFTNWDHYAEPTALHNLSMSYQPDYILLADGDALVLEYDCTKIGTTPANPHGNVVVYLWYTETP